jgi:hypothetical protein
MEWRDWMPITGSLLLEAILFGSVIFIILDHGLLSIHGLDVKGLPYLTVI